MLCCRFRGRTRGRAWRQLGSRESVVNGCDASGIRVDSTPMRCLLLLILLLPVACTSAGVSTDATSTGGHIILDGGGDPPVPPDGKALCPKGACNYKTNEGCAA